MTAPFATDHGTLTDYELDWHMPVQHVTAGAQLAAMLHCRLLLAGAPVATTRPHGFFEDALADIQRQMPRDIVLKACISCAYSDYHPAGSGLSGSLACFRDNKAAYLQVSGKRELFQVWDTRTEFVRETHLCPHYAQLGRSRRIPRRIPRP